MALTPSQAAAAVGMTKQGLIRYIHKGKLSATRNERGNFEIDPSELTRVFPSASTTVKFEAKGDGQVSPHQSNGVNGVDDKVTLLERIIREKEDALRAANDQILDLRRRLDEEANERRRLTALLEALTPPQPTASRSWWARLLGRGGE